MDLCLYIRALINHRIRASRSHESLLQINTPSSMHSIDMSAQDIEIKPLHSSILGQEHCFQVSTSNGSKFYSCRSAEEREKWIQHLRKTVKPTQEQTRRTEYSLKISIQEAKNVPSKKRYYCELCLDNALYARTSTKCRGDMLFWGEQFDFNNLPPVKTITINLYKEADKKKKKEKNQLLAYINISVSDVSQRQLVERWYAASSAIVGKAGRDTKNEQPILRIKARFQKVQILPMDMYQDLLQYLETDYSMLVQLLEPHISVKSKEEIATALVHILQKQGHARDFLSDIVMAEVDKLENESLTFRGNSIATKAMEAFLKLTGEKFMHDTLSDFIRTVVESGDDCEVDPIKVPNNATLQRQQKNLKMFCEMAWFKIVNSHCFFPSDLRWIFYSFRECCEERKRSDLSDNLISSCIFLRFLCPAILSPSLFNLVQEFPHERAARSLTLVAKTIQCLGNFTQFGAKEEFMTFMNEFVDNELPNAKMFIDSISSPDTNDRQVDFDGYIDLGKELSTIHTLLVESLEKVNDAASLKLSKLKDILDDITNAERNPQTLRRTPLNSSKGIYDNVNLVKTSHDQNANKPDAVVLTELLYKDADLSKSSDSKLVDGDKAAYPDILYSSQGRLRTGISAYHSTEDHIRYTRLEDPPSVTSFTMSPSTYTSKRPEEKQVNRCWDKMVRAAEMVNGDRVDLITFVDDSELEAQNSSMDSADRVSVSQLSTVASSGYQSIGYSQSNSPVEVPQDNLQNYQGAHGGSQQPLSFSNPLFCHSNTLTSRSNGHDDSFRSSTSTLPRESAFRSPSTSSLSSDDGLLNTTSSSSCSQAQSATLPNVSHNTTSSHSYPRSTHAGHPFDRRLRNGSTSSMDSTLSSTSQDPRQRSHRQHVAASRPYNSPRLSKSHPLVNASTTNPREVKLPPSPALVTTDLSRSAEFTTCKQSPKGMRRIMTDSVIHPSVESPVAGVYTPPESPHFGTLPSTWRTSSHGPSVRMSTKTASPHKPTAAKNEKSTHEYEHELTQLRQQLAMTQTMLAETQDRLDNEETNRQRLVSEMGQALQSREQEQGPDKQEHIQNIMSKLHTAEQVRRSEQDKLQFVINRKQHLIDEQNRKIQSLDGANTKLLSALSQLKDRCQVQSRNGVASPMRQKIPLDNEEFKQSSC